MYFYIVKKFIIQEMINDNRGRGTSILFESIIVFINGFGFSYLSAVVFSQYQKQNNYKTVRI
ncbi:MAG: hypothetical protein A2W91_13480 [Bacteroidetes bacterium GWF2_38_335]|nr:MAG: hypothetical protein A2W91_13480 [Bacteroidetes bacterium GWF2_38_335]OFY77263.1 MAG: hypothetical protein A2281_15145 [Bacteroidetes bacterium RIFOXYA12_FULL_38_20]HBS85733.1 hypothetical protein [Bacteroidales bacterium]